MKTHLVSIIIPVYNSEVYLDATIQSALAQIWPNKEIIIVDDGSVDGSLSIAKKYEGDQVKVFSQKNTGASAARNKGLQEARGDYIQFLDADDLIMPDKIQKQIAQLKNKPEAVAICPIVDFATDGTNLLDLKPSLQALTFFKNEADPLKFLLNLYDVENNLEFVVPIHSWLVPSKLIKNLNWDESLSVNDDGEFFCRVVLLSKEIISVNDTLGYYRKYVKTDRISLSGRKDAKSLESQYRSLLLILHHLGQAKGRGGIEEIITKNLMVLLMQTYPQHKQLSRNIQQKIKEIGGTKYSPELGGKKIEFIKKKMGWKIARILQFYYKNITFGN